METDTSEQMKPTWSTKIYPLPWKCVARSSKSYSTCWIEAANGEIVIDVIGNIHGPAICEACNDHHKLRTACQSAFLELSRIAGHACRDQEIINEVRESLLRVAGDAEALQTPSPFGDGISPWASYEQADIHIP